MFSELSDAAVAFAQAKEALGLYEAGLVHSADGGAPGRKQIMAFDDCAVEYLAKSLPQSAKGLVNASYANLVVQAIADADELSNTDNYRFLYEYLLHERRASELTEVLHMHRNNVKYRIDRIESRFGIDTSDPKLRFALLLAFRIREVTSKL